MYDHILVAHVEYDSIDHMIYYIFDNLVNSFYIDYLAFFCQRLFYSLITNLLFVFVYYLKYLKLISILINLNINRISIEY